MTYTKAKPSIKNMDAYISYITYMSIDVFKMKVWQVSSSSLNLPFSKNAWVP